MKYTKRLIQVENMETEVIKCYHDHEFRQNAFNAGLISQRAFEELDIRTIINLVRIARKHLQIEII